MLVLGALVVGVLVGVVADLALGTGSDGAPPDGAVTVAGRGDCTVTGSSRESIDGTQVIEEDFTCELTFSDDRVQGTEELVVTTRVDDWETGGTWTATGTITTADGTWEGSGQGVFSMTGNLPAGAEGISPANFGEMRYVGRGGHDGLTFQYYFAGTNTDEGISGWIEGSDAG